MSKKLKILFHSDFALANTGFGKNTKNILSYLFNTNKYEIVSYSCGLPLNAPDLKRTPWKSYGTMPDNQFEFNNILNQFPAEQREFQARGISYGAYYLDQIIMQEKPDVYIGVQDIWGVDYAIDRFWFPNIHSVIWTTLDSLPLLPSAVEKAPKINNYWIWSDFATKEMHRLNNKHVKTIHGAVDSKNFYKIDNHKRLDLRRKFNIDDNSFVIGFVFRNQLRKSVPNLLEGYKIFKKHNPKIKSNLLLHTNFSEGWNIHKLADEYNLDKNEILTTYVCRACKHYHVKSFVGQDQNCPDCKTEKSCITTNVACGVDENQLNEIYNLMDVYVHPFTSGGQEIPIQEAKLVQLITLVTNYSCGEELCESGSGSFPLEWAEYREQGTEFRKASTYPSSIAKQLQKIYEMDLPQREKIGKTGRDWTIKNYAIESVGKQIEDFLDNLSPVQYDYIPKLDIKNPNAKIEEIKDNGEWIKSLYKNILNMNVDEKDSGYQHWIAQISKQMPRKQIEDFFRQTANQENNKNTQIQFSDTLDKDDEGKRIILVMPEAIGDIFIITATFESLKKQYPWANLYVATKPEFFDVLIGNPHIHKLIQYIPQMDSQVWLEGIGSHKGFFELSFHPYFNTQRNLNYLNNGKTNLALKLQD